jgi:hypothetical protein
MYLATYQSFVWTIVTWHASTCEVAPSCFFLTNLGVILAHFTLWVKANVQLKSSIPIGAKVETGPKGFTLGIKAEIEKKKFQSAPSY